MKNTIRLLIGIAAATLAMVTQAQTTTNLPPGNTSQIANLLGSAGANLGHLATDAEAAFKDFNFKDASGGVIGLKVPDGYGMGIDLHSISTNSPVELGLGLFGIQEKQPVTSKTGVISTKTGFAFYDASLSIGLSTTETIPVIGIPVRLMIESGPAFKLGGIGSGVIMEQSAAYADLDFAVNTHFTITAGAGVVHCSDPHFNGKALPMIHLNLDWSF